MSATSVRVGLFAAIACASGLVSTAHADIYTWVDAAGKINVSNLTPPDDVRVTKVVRETPRPTAADPALDAQYQRQVQLLSERVRQLELELQSTPREAAPAPPPVVVAPVVQYFTAPSAPMPYAPVVEAMTSPGCDPSWYGCGAWWGSTFFPSSAVVFGQPARRGFTRFDHWRHPAPRPIGRFPPVPVVGRPIRR